MKKNLLKAMLVAMGMVMGIQTSQAQTLEATLDFTAAIQGGSNTAGKSYNEVTHYYNNWGATGWVAQAYAGFSFEIPEGMAVSGATLSFTSNASRGNRTIDVNIMSGEDFDYETLELKSKAAAGINLVTLNENADKSTKTVDCTTQVKGFIEQGINSVVFVFSNAAAGGTLQGYGSAEKPTLTLTLADAGTQTNYIIKFVDAEGNDLKEPIRRSGTIGDEAILAETDANSFKVNGVKYIWQSDNSPITLGANEADNVISVVFAEAPKWHYVLQSNLGTGNLAEGDEYADETVNVGYPRYYLYTRNGNLYEAARSQSSAGWYLFGIEMTEPTVYGEVTYNMETPAYQNVVYYQELENVEGMTFTTANLHDVRCSNGAGGYNGTEGDITLTTLQPGNYIIHFAIRGSKNGYTMPLLVGGERYEYTTDGNMQEFDLELKITSSADVVIPAGSGNSVNVYDFMYIRSVPETINWTVKGSEGTTIFAGGSYQGEPKTIAVPKFIWNQEAQSLSMTANNGDAGWYQHNFIPETEGQEFEVTYEAGPQGVVLYAEAEDVEGMSKATGSNANIRCSQGAGGFNNGEGEVVVGTVPESGEYVVVFAVWGGEGTEMTVNAGGNPFTITTTGSLTEQTSEPMSLSAGATITIPVCGNSSHVIDYVYVQKADYATAIKGVKQVSTDDNAIYNLAGQQVKSAQKGIFIQNGKKVVK